MWKLCTLSFTSCGVIVAPAAPGGEPQRAIAAPLASLSAGDAASELAPPERRAAAADSPQALASAPEPAARSDEREVHVEAFLRMYLRLASGRPVDSR